MHLYRLLLMKELGPGETAQQLRVLAAFVEALSSVPITHIEQITAV